MNRSKLCEYKKTVFHIESYLTSIKKLRTQAMAFSKGLGYTYEFRALAGS